MEYCLQYKISSKYLYDVDELIIQWHNNTIYGLYSFLEDHEDQTIILNCANKKELDDFLKAINKKVPNLKIMMHIESFQDEEYQYAFDTLNKYEIPYFFSYVAKEWEEYCNLIKNGVSDIYISNQLCFELDYVKNEALKNNVKLRAYANISQGSILENNPWKRFFIRPEDVEDYDEYIDVIEFYDSFAIQDIYYEIYALKKTWPEELGVLIKNMPDTPLRGDTALPLKSVLATCGRTCYFNDRCHICDRLIDLSNTLADKKFSLKIN